MTTASPEELVVALPELKVPQAPAGDGDSVKETVSPETARPLGEVTTAVIAEEVEPLAESTAGEADTLTVLDGVV